MRTYPGPIDALVGFLIDIRQIEIIDFWSLSHILCLISIAFLVSIRSGLKMGHIGTSSVPKLCLLLAVALVCPGSTSLITVDKTVCLEKDHPKLHLSKIVRPYFLRFRCMNDLDFVLPHILPIYHKNWFKDKHLTPAGPAHMYKVATQRTMDLQ